MMTKLQGMTWRQMLAPLVMGLLLVGLGTGSYVWADEKEEPKAEEPAKEEGPSPAALAALVRRPQTIVTKDSSVADAVKFIDTELAKQWLANSITPSHLCSDYEFIRRASLDLIGRIATPDEISQYLRDSSTSRRSLLIERLLKSDEYPRHWANLWANWLLTRSGPFGKGMYHEQLHTWLEDQFANNRPFNQILTDLLTASGKNTENGAVNFILAHVGEPIPQDKQSEEGRFEMVPITSRVTRLFLGIQTQCTQCHDHPFDANLKQNHFWGINAFFRQVERKGNPAMDRRNTQGPLELVVNTSLNPDGFVFYEKRNAVVLQTRATFLDGQKLADGNDRRSELAKMIVEHENFPKALINRMWAHLLGRGFTNPIDDFNDQNFPSNPELLDGMAKQWRHYGFDQHKLIRWICNSHAYQLSTVANKTNDRADTEVFFSRMVLKSLSPEQLFESLMTATNAEEAQTKEGKKALRDQWMSTLISNFGDDEGNEVNFNGTVVQALLMMNGKDINTAICGPKATVATMLAKRGSPAQYINHLYLATLNRPASANEARLILSKMPMRVRERDAAGPWHDLLWALLNSNEFLLNH